MVNINLIWYFGFALYNISLHILSYSDNAIPKLIWGDDDDTPQKDFLWLLIYIAMDLVWPLVYLIMIGMIVWKKHELAKRRNERDEKIDKLLGSGD